MADSDPQSRFVKLSPAQRMAAKFLTKSAAACVPVTVFAEIDVTEMVALHTRLRTNENPLSITHILLAALAHSLHQHPHLNAHFHENELEVFNDVNIGLAVSLDSGDLVTPVLRDVARKSPSEISQDVTRIVEKARSGALKLPDMRGAGFTFSSLGNSPTAKFATPIIPMPQVAILAVTAIREMAIVVNGTVKAAPILPISLTFDHRAINGIAGNAFLDTLARMLATPEGLLNPAHG